MNDTILRILGIALIVSCAALLSAAALFALSYWQLRKLTIESQDFFGTLRQIPITVPLALDALDLALDTFSAPVSWFILGRLGLSGLQLVTLVEELVPGTQLVPLMTLSWFGIRLHDRLLLLHRVRPIQERIAASIQALWRRKRPHRGLPPSK